jgi:hypothetical protein
MPTITLDDLLKPDVVLGTISRTRFHHLTFTEALNLVPRTTFSDDANPNLNTANSETFPARSVSIDIYNRVRSGVDIVPPLAPAKRLVLNPIGNANYTVARMHPSIYLEWDRMSNRRAIGSGATVLDNRGQRYVAKQVQTLAGRLLNTLEILVLGLLQDSLYMSGSTVDSWTPTFTSGSSIGRIRSFIPTGNLTTLNMTGGGASISGDWSQSATTILTDLGKIDDGFTYVTGYPLRHVWVNGIWWNYIINNTEVRTAAGTASTPFSSFEYIDGLGSGGDRDTLPYRQAELKALPGVTWHINNERIDVAGTTVKKIPDGRAYFMTEIDNDVVQLGTFAELISEQTGQAPTPHDGLTVWYQYLSNPSVVEVMALLNAIPMFKIPGSFAYGSINNA